MVNIKLPSYYLSRIIDDLNFVIENTRNISLDDFSKNDILNCAISFKFIQISVNAKQLPGSFIVEHSYIPWHKINGLRNRIVHDYGNVQLDIIFNTIKNDLPIILTQLKKL